MSVVVCMSVHMCVWAPLTCDDDRFSYKLKPDITLVWQFSIFFCCIFLTKVHFVALSAFFPISKQLQTSG